MALTEKLIDDFIERYLREYDLYTKLSAFIAAECQQVLQDNAIRGSVQWRPKNPDRLRAKLLGHMASGENASSYTDVDSIFRTLKDLSGVRVTTYVESDRPRVVELIRKRFKGFEADGSTKPDVKDSTKNFYRATHCLVKVAEEDLDGNNRNLKDVRCEIQVCSLLAHVYNEIEHDLRYKPFSGKLEKHEDGLLNILGKLTETGDTVIMETLDAVEKRQRQSTADFEDVHDFVSRVRGLFPVATNFAANAGQLYEMCLALDIDTVDKLKEALNWQEGTAARGAARAEALSRVVNANQGIQLEMDPLSSDQLLVLLLEDHNRVDRLKELYPSGRGMGRPPRFLSVAKHLQELPAV